MRMNMMRGFAKKATAVFLAFGLSVMIPATAFAANDVNTTVVANATAKDVSVEVGNVTPTYGNKCIDADAADGHTATVKAGNLTTEENVAISADATSLGVIDIQTGNVISAKDSGLQAKIEGEGTITATLGDVASGEQGAGIWTSADDRDVLTHESSITVKAGDVNAEGEGIVVRPYEHSRITVEAGDVNAKSNGIEIVAENGAFATMSANDVTSGKSGIFLFTGEGSVVDVLVTGTLSGEKAPITFFGSEWINAGSFTLTAWKINFNDSIVMMANTDAALSAQANSSDGSAARAAANAMDKNAYTLNTANADFSSSVEKSILYIMKLTQPDSGATLFATDANGKPLATSHGYSVAKEGDRVLLKVRVGEGSELLAAYDGAGNEVKLVKGEDGCYYITYTVPRGGGIGLSVILNGDLVNLVDDEQQAALRAMGAANGKPANTLANTGDSLHVLPLAAIALFAAVALTVGVRKRAS